MRGLRAFRKAEFCKTKATQAATQSAHNLPTVHSRACPSLNRSANTHALLDTHQRGVAESNEHSLHCFLRTPACSSLQRRARSIDRTVDLGVDFCFTLGGGRRALQQGQPRSREGEQNTLEPPRAMKQIKALLARTGTEPRAGEASSPEASAMDEAPAAAAATTAAGPPPAPAEAPSTSG